MASRIEVTISELQSAANNINQYAQDYKSAADSLKSAADALAGTWEGDSQVAFVTEQEQAYNWYTRMSELCVEYANAMKDAAQKYADTDTQAANNIRQR